MERGAAHQPLMSAVTPAYPSLSPYSSTRMKLSGCNLAFRSGSVILILLWNVIVGTIYGVIQCSLIALALDLKNELESYQVIQVIVAGFAATATMQILIFPVGGLLADICYGRYKIVHFSFIKITAGFIFLTIAGVLSYCHIKFHGVVLFCAIMCAILLTLGFAGFQSNAIQFGLDQLQDAPSQELSSFLHLYVWTNNFGEMTARIIGTVMLCSRFTKKNIQLVPIIYVILCLLLLVIGFCKHRWFQCEPKCQNPYGVVFRVLKFVAKNKYPLRRSARTYCGDMTPTRMDYANTLFGGPFSVEAVEDVKTFLRMLVMLVLICPVFYYYIPVSSLYPLYGFHVGRNPLRNDSHCSGDWVLLQSGNLSLLITFIALPSYFFFVLPKITKVAPKILHRLLIGIFLLIVSVLIMCVLYAAAIGRHAAHDHVNNATCLFSTNFTKNSHSTSLNLEPLAFTIPNVIIGVSMPIIDISVLEFTSAQSPYPMKGLLLGTFYAVKGFYVLIGCSVLCIFTTHPFQRTRGFLDCGFIYYLINASLGIACLCLAVKANKWYRYRTREEKPYDHHYVEDYYSQYACKNTESYNEPINQSHHNYGSVKSSD